MPSRRSSTSLRKLARVVVVLGVAAEPEFLEQYVERRDLRRDARVRLALQAFFGRSSIRSSRCVRRDRAMGARARSRTPPARAIPGLFRAQQIVGDLRQTRQQRSGTDRL